MRNMTREIVQESRKFKLGDLAIDLGDDGFAQDHILLALFKNGVASAFALRDAVISLRKIVKKRARQLNEEQVELRRRQRQWGVAGPFTKKSPVMKEREIIRKNRGRIAELVAVGKSLDLILRTTSEVDFVGNDPTARSWAEKNLKKPVAVKRSALTRVALTGVREVDRHFYGRVGARPLKLVPR